MTATEPTGRPKSENLKQAEADLAAALEAQKLAEGTLATLKAQAEAARDELSRLENLHEPSQKEIHHEELLRRKLRRVENDTMNALDAMNEANAAFDRAERRHGVALLADLDAEIIDLDVAYLAYVRASERGLAEMRKTIFARLRKAHELNFWLRPGSHWTHRGALSGIPAEGVQELVAAQETVDRAAALERQRAQNAPERA